MTNPTLNSSSDARADIAFLKRMAMEGRGEPAPALVLMAVFGLVFGVLALGLFIQIATANGGAPFAQSGPWAWYNRFSMPVASLAFLAALGWTAWRSFAADRRPLNRGALAAWSGAFLALLVVLVVIRVFTRNEPPTDAVYGVYLTAPFLLTLWGVAWWTTAIVSRRPWLTMFALASWAMAILAAWVGNSLPILAIAAASLLGLAFLPATILMVQKRA